MSSFAPQSQRGQATCAQHPETFATFSCTRCGTFGCSACTRLTTDGQDICEACVPFDRSFVPAGRGQRFRANLIDGLVYVVPFFPIVIGIAMRAEPTISLVLSLLGLVGLVGLVVLQLRHALRGQSVGKKAMGIRVVRKDGSPVSLARLLLLRNLVPGLVGSIVPGVSFLDALLIFGSERRCGHDYIADTMVIAVESEG